MTSPDLHPWPPTDSAYRRSEVTAVVGHGEAVWHRAAKDVLVWKVKTASGFAVDSAGPVSPGDRVLVTARLVAQRIVQRRYLRALR